jgi:uncharacterized YigZ family protein
MAIMIPDYYSTIEKPSIAEFKDRGSRFIAYAFPVSDVSDFKEKLVKIKKEHPKAAHHCFAYRIGSDRNVYRVSDDGEPYGTAGKPILGQIDSKQLTDVLIIVVRYFGGTLLGPGGLINAYKNAAALALQVTPLVQKPVLVSYHLQFDYTVMNDIMTISKQFNCWISKQETKLFCSLVLAIPKKRLDEVLQKLGNLRGIEMEKV